MSRHTVCHRLSRAAASLLCLVFLGSALALPVTDERELLPGQAVALRLEAGEVEIAAGEPGKTQVAAELAPGQRLVWRDAGDRQVLVVDDRERLRARPARLRLSVPADADLLIRLGDASLRLAGVGGQRLRVEGGQGDVRIQTAARNVSLETTGGDIEANVAAGRLSTRSVAGGQSLAVAGSNTVDAASVGGSIEARLAAGGRVRLASVGGGLTLQTGPSAELDAALDTLSGPIALRLPVGQPLVVDLAQACGDLDLPAVFTAGPDGRLRVGEGGGRVRLASFAGAVSIRVVPVPVPGAAAPTEGPPAAAAPPPPSGQP